MPTTFANTIDGNDIFAKRAECDAAGNDLSTTYATKSELPTIMGLTAGSNITITEGQDSITISATDTTYSAGTGLSLSGTTFSNSDPLPAHTSTESGKVLGVDSNGDLGWVNQSGGGGSYSAGNGIDITNDVISVDTSVVATQTDLAGKEDAFDVGTGLEMDTSGATPTLQVEAPVDIVAGPGIVIDNPDGNTLRVSMATDYEVELYSGTASNTNVALNEALDNFERIKIYAYWKGTNTYDYYGYSVTEIYASELVASRRFTVNVFTNINSDQLYSIANFLVNPTKTQFSLINTVRATFGGQLVSTADGPVIYKVVGIHRIAGGN